MNVAPPQSPPVRVERLSKGFYLGWYVGGTLAGVVLLIAGIFIWPLLVVAIPLIICAEVVWYVLLYKAWASIQDGHARTGPCKAVGFCFIPFFSWYWVFQAYWGFAKDYNAYVSRRTTSPVRRLPEGLFLAYSILIVVGVLPLVNIVLVIPQFIIGAVMINAVCDGVNSLPQAPNP